MSRELIAHSFFPADNFFNQTLDFALTYGAGCYCRACDARDGENDRHVVMLEVKFNHGIDRIWLCDDCLLRIHNAAVSLQPQEQFS